MPEAVTNPGRLNWVLLAGAACLALLCLWAASHASSMIVALCAAILFSFVGNTLFSLLHEAVHGNFDAVPWRNEAAGTVAAAFFPTSFSAQRSFHLTHHRNNRSEQERFDLIGPTENIPLKTAQWFTILSGIYWLSAPAFCLVFALFGGLVPWRRMAASGDRFSRQTSAAEFLASAAQLPLWRVRAEVLFALALHAILAFLLGLSLTGWLLCYGAFALNWSSLQYSDHAFSALDRKEGAWNLRVGTLTRRFFLNYHDHLVHHREPHLAWRQLPGRVNGQDPSHPFLRILYLMWKGPRLLVGGVPDKRQRLLDLSIVAAHSIIFAAAFLLIYGSASLAYGNAAHLRDVSLAIDRGIPFIPAMGAVYLSITLLLLAVPLKLRDPALTLPFLATLLVQLAFAWLCFQLFPVALPPVPEAGDGIGAMLYRLADAGNLEGNEMPSLHVCFAISSAWMLSRGARPVAALLYWLWAALICASTLLLRQHYVLDVVAGAALAIATMALLFPWLKQQLASAEAEVIALRGSAA